MLGIDVCLYANGRHDTTKTSASNQVAPQRVSINAADSVCMSSPTFHKRRQPSRSRSALLYSYSRMTFSRAIVRSQSVGSCCSEEPGSLMSFTSLAIPVRPHFKFPSCTATCITTPVTLLLIIKCLVSSATQVALAELRPALVEHR